MKDRQGRGAASEVTLWAVDYGVLSLTGVSARPTSSKSVYVEEGAAGDERRQPAAHHSPPRADAEGRHRRRRRRRRFGRGHAAARTSACWRSGSDPSPPTRTATRRRREAAGVADDLPDHGGRRAIEARGSARPTAKSAINKPLTLKPTFPRFLAVGDKASFGAVVTSQLKAAGHARRSRSKSLDPDDLQFADTAPQTVRRARRRIGRGAVRRGGPGDRPRARADDGQARRRDRRVRGRHPGRSAGLAGNRGGHTARRPTRRRRRRNADAFPRGVVHGLRRAARRAVVHGAWSVSARARATSSSIRTAARSSEARARWRSCWPPISATRSRCPASSRHRSAPAVQQPLKELEQFQCASGGFAYWPGECWSVVAVPDRVPAARLQGRGRPEVRRGRGRCASAPMPTLETASSAREAADERELVAVLHRLAGVRGQGARRRRAQPGLEHHPPLWLSRSDAGLRAGVPARRAGREGRDGRSARSTICGAA